MEKAKARAVLKKLQGIVHMRGDEELPKVLEELRDAIDEAQASERGSRFGRDRKERGGRDRKE